MKPSAVVMLHGWGYTPAIWEDLAGELDFAPVHFPLLRALPHQSLEEWADKLAQDIPADSVIVGWSLGAMLTICLAVRHPQKVRALVLIGATPRFDKDDEWLYGLDRETVTAFCAAFAKQPHRTMERFLALQTLNEAHRHIIKNTLSATLVNIETEQASLLAGLYLLAHSDLRHLIVQQPCLLIHGENDALMPLSAAQWLQKHYPQAKLESYPNTGHAPFVSNPYRVGQDIKRFLRAL